MHLRACRQRHRGGIAAVELAVLLPLLAFLFVIGIDFARLFYPLVTITNAAHSGCVYGAQDKVRAADAAEIAKKALADATDLTPPPTVKSVQGVDALGYPCLKVTVSWTFQTVSRFPAVPSTVELSRTVQMRIAPSDPKEPVAVK